MSFPAYDGVLVSRIICDVPVLCISYYSPWYQIPTTAVLRVAARTAFLAQRVFGFTVRVERHSFILFEYNPRRIIIDSLDFFKRSQINTNLKQTSLQSTMFYKIIWKSMYENQSQQILID